MFLLACLPLCMECDLARLEPAQCLAWAVPPMGPTAEVAAAASVIRWNEEMEAELRRAEPPLTLVGFTHWAC